jgi:hypothetical protein
MDTLANALDAFFTEHRRCPGDMDGSAVVWLACETCGARIVREA